MQRKNRLIIDTDPGCDDVLALLLALAASGTDPDIQTETEVLLISVTFGNVHVRGCLQNLISTFHVIEKELDWRRRRGHKTGFDVLSRCKPIVAVGAERPLSGEQILADYYHGKDGLGGVSESHPHHTAPESTWSHLFSPSLSDDPITITAAITTDTSFSSTQTVPPALFTPSKNHAIDEILAILKDNPPDSITLVALGPLTNFSMAAAKDCDTFLRAKEVLVMGGAVSVPGNITPVAEFNTIADPLAAARIYALTSPDPKSTMPPGQPDMTLTNAESLKASRLRVKLFPLDITSTHLLHQASVQKVTDPLIAAGSPLAEWFSAFTSATFDKNASLHTDQGAYMVLHDPLVVWHVISTSPDWTFHEDVDVRVETSGQWARGMCIVDRRGRQKVHANSDTDTDDNGNWLSARKGNRVAVCTGTPGENVCAKVLMNAVFQ